MDIDRFIADNEPTWTELASLSKRSRSLMGSRRLKDDETERLIAAYQRTATHLSYARSTFGDIPLVHRLTILVGDARANIYGRTDRPGSVIRRFFFHQFPGEVWAGRYFVAVAAALFLIPALYVGVWLSVSDAALDASAPEYVRNAYIENDFEDYYSSEPAATFSTKVLVNNIQVSILAFAGGIFAGVGTIVTLVVNGSMLGDAAGLFHSAGQAPKFWGLILPHGLLEITAIVIAGGAGLQIGWAMVAPGDRRRSDAFIDLGRRSITIILGLTLAFVVAGLIEGFVTPSSLPTPARVGIGLAVETAFLSYIVIRGRQAELDSADPWAEPAAKSVTAPLGS